MLAEIAPVLILAPPAGPWVDRLPRVQVMISADIVRVVLAAVLAVWHSEITVVYAVAFGLSAGSVFFNPAAGPLLPALVDDDELVDANSGIWSAAVLGQVLLAPAAGLIAATAGYGWALAVNVGSFAVSAALLRGLRVTQPPIPVGTGNLWTQGVEALHLVARDRLLRRLAVGQAFAAQVRRPQVVFAAFEVRGAVDLALASVTALPAAFGAFDLIWRSMRLASLVGGGLLADRLGIRSVYYVGGALLIAAALAGVTTSAGGNAAPPAPGDDGTAPPAAQRP